MGCGILYRMVAERIGLSATLATRRTIQRGETCALESISFAFHTLSIISLHVQSLTLVNYCLPA
jgi:hypothetical protein